MRIIASFAISKELSLISHLDLLRFINRALRRTGLPVAYSQGFNPHMLLGFASPLSVGMSSVGELIEIELAKDIDEAELDEKLFFAPSLPIMRKKLLTENKKSLMSRIGAGEYIINTSCNSDLFAMVETLMQHESILVSKKSKTKSQEVDIKPLILHFEKATDYFSKNMDKYDIEHEYMHSIINENTLFVRLSHVAGAFIKCDLFLDTLLSQSTQKTNRDIKRIRILEKTENKLNRFI